MPKKSKKSGITQTPQRPEQPSQRIVERLPSTLDEAIAQANGAAASLLRFTLKYADVPTRPIVKPATASDDFALLEDWCYRLQVIWDRLLQSVPEADRDVFAGQGLLSAFGTQQGEPGSFKTMSDGQILYTYPEESRPIRRPADLAGGINYFQREGLLPHGPAKPIPPTCPSLVESDHKGSRDNHWPQLEDEAYTILTTRCDSPTRLKAIELDGDRRTISRHLKELVAEGLVDYESRSKKGAAITVKGRTFLERKT